VRVIVRLDESAPELLKAFRKSAPCKITVSWTSKDKDGAKATYFHTTFENARIVKWCHYTAHTANRANQELPHSLEIAWSYEKTTATNEKWVSTAKTHPKKMDTFQSRNPTA
jgi:type VI secretion system Hcp family effector